MKTTGRRALALLVVALIAIAIAAAVAFGIRERTAPRSPDQLVSTTWKDARETPMHVLHVGTKKIACTECHGASETPGSAPVVPSATCTKCHEHETQLGHGHRGPAREGRQDAGASATTNAMTCLSCHVFGANKSAARCNDCHATETRAVGAPDLRHHATTNTPCGKCHAVHREDRTTLADCTTCHLAVTATHGAFTAHGSTGDGGLTLSATRDGGVPLDTGQMCTACHAPHAGKEAARATCEGCHLKPHASAPTDAFRPPALEAFARAAPRVAPRGSRVAGHEACTTCHEPHKARRTDARSCRACHADHAGVSSVAGHAACTGCHEPHAPAEARTSCTASCHGNVTTLASAKAPPHAECSSCHDPHRPEASPAQACVRCHEQTKNQHGGRGVRGAHEKIGTCTTCHEPHSSKPAEPNRQLCAKCHAEKVTATVTRPGHGTCTSCHGTAHSPIAKPACASCHAEETKTAHSGHSKCTTCHDAHSGALETRASCTSCHQTKVKALHGSTPQGCASCHRPHGGAGTKGPASPPACASCHSRPSLQGLHSLGGHGTCATCHTSHGPPRSDRSTCTTGCHADRRNHQPEATACKGCHLFRD